jgi:hypothetical protein
MKGKWFLAVLSLLLILTPGLYAQEQTGAISGTVVDNQNQPLPGATVEAISQSGLTLRTVTDEKGRFRFPRVLLGTYKITASISGFIPAEVKDVAVALGKEVTVTFTLQPGFAEEVTVTAGGALVDVTSNAVARSFTAEEIANLPLPRDYSAVVTLAAGARQEDFLAGISIDGASGAENRFYIDGVDTSDPVEGTQGQGLVTDFVQEVQVKSAGYNPEYGGALGGVINVVTKTGTNQFSGSVGLFYRDDSLEPASRNAGDPVLAPYTDGRVCGPGLPCRVKYNKDTFSVVEPTVTLGGPVLRDRLWFFFGLDQRKTSIDRRPWVAGTDPRQPQVGTATFSQDDTYTYLTANLKGQLADNLLLKAAANVTRRKVEGALPAENGTTPATADLSVGTKYPRDTYSLYADYVASPNFLISARLGRFSLDENSFGYDARYRILFQNGNSAYRNRQGPFDPNTGFDWRPVGFSTVPAASFFATDFDKWTRDEVSADATWYFEGLGSHQVKGGVQYFKVKNRESYGEVGNLYIIRWGLADRFGIGVRGRYGSVEVRRFREEGTGQTNNLGVFLQDSWAILPNLTVNYGLRAEKEKVPTYFSAQVRREQNLPDSFVEWDFKDKLAPRIGFSWDVFKNQTFKVYGSWGKYYDIMKIEMPRQSFGAARWISYIYPLDRLDWANWPNNCQNSTNDPNGNPCGNFFGADPVRLDLRHPTDPREGVDPDLKPMQNREWQLGFEYQVSRTGVLGLRYVNKKLIDTIEDIGYIAFDQNGNPYETYITGNPGKGIVGGDPDGDGPLPPQAKAIRDYEGLELSFEKRFSDNWYGRAYLLFSKLEGNYSGLASSDEFGRNDPNIERYFDGLPYGYDSYGRLVDGPLNTDRPITFSLQGAYRMPWNMTVGVNTSYRSGGPRTTLAQIFGVEFYPNGRNDMGRGPGITQTDLWLAQDFKLGGLNFQVNLTVLNLFDQRTPTRFWTYKYLEDVCNDFNGCSDHYGDYNYYFSQMVPYNLDEIMPSDALDPRYGKPVAWQAPRQVRLGFKLTF